MKNRLLVILIFSFFSLQAAQQPPLVEPPFWWVGMKNNKLQLLVHAEDIGKTKVVINSKLVRLIGVDTAESPNYAFLNIEINKETEAGVFEIKFILKNRTAYKYYFELKNRISQSSDRKGFGSEDVIYLLMPDRFSNGNATNDNVGGILEKADRSNPDGRHGGDIQGIENHLNYIHQLGVTALWINPLLENNMPKYSYHGYAITDFYKIDARFGSNADYANLSQKAKKNGLKMIQDMVFNHCASGHWWMEDLPFNDWVNQFPEFTRSNYRSETIMDPHASKSDKKLMSNGWFDRSMPDLNQKNPFLATYLIQNSIWWIEFAGLSGIRMDTYPYADQEFMANWVKAVFGEYPNFNIVGETWLQSEAQTAWFQNNSFSELKPTNHLNSVTDFPLCYAANAAVNQKDSWTEGVAQLYMTLSKDFLYPAPDSNVIFLDNHDLSRFASNIDSDVNKYKIGLGFLATTRGIPMIYYGTEIMMLGKKENGDGGLRADFPGGWAGDSVSVFENTNLSENQKQALEYFQILFNFRKESMALQKGSLTQYIPIEGVYVYFRDYRGTSSHGEIVMVIINNNDSSMIVDLKRFNESFKNRKSAEDIFTHTNYSLQKPIKTQAKSITILKIH